MSVTREYHRPLLALGQSLWLVLTLSCVLLFLLGVPASYRQNSHPPHAVLVDLSHSGVSLEAYAVYMTALGAIFAVVSICLAAIIAWRRFGDVIGLVTSLFLVLFAAGGSASDAFPALTSLSNLIGAIQIPMLVAFLLLFPDGRFVPRWSRVPYLIWLATTIWPPLVHGSQNVDPLPQLAGVVFGIGAQIYRYRAASDPVKRQQAKWVLFAIALFLMTLLFSIVFVSGLALVPTIGPRGSSYDLTSTTITSIGYLLIPIAIFMAILRHGLWEIDVLINRTLVYGALTVSLAATYIGTVVGIQALLREVAGQNSDLAIAISTLLVAALFSPWRRRLQIFIDRRFYRRKYDAARTLAAFQIRLRNEIDLDDLQAGIVTAIQETIQPSLISVWFRTEESRAP